MASALSFPRLQHRFKRRRFWGSVKAHLRLLPLAAVLMLLALPALADVLVTLNGTLPGDRLEAEAGDTVLLCAQPQTSAATPANDACAYDVQTQLVLPPGFVAAGDPADLTLRFGTLLPGEQAAEQCIELVIDDATPSATCFALDATSVLQSDAAGSGAPQNLEVSDALPDAVELCTLDAEIRAIVSSNNDTCTIDDNVAAGELITYTAIEELAAGFTSTLVVDFEFDETRVELQTASVSAVGGALTSDLFLDVVAEVSADSALFRFNNITGRGGSSAIERELVLTFTTRVLSDASAAGDSIVASVSSSPNGQPPAAADGPLSRILSEPSFVLSSSFLPIMGGAFGDGLEYTVVREHATTSNGCAHDLLVCETVAPDFQYAQGSLQVNSTVAVFVDERSDGFCVSMDSLFAADGNVTFTFDVAFLDLAPGDDVRCNDANVTFTSSPRGDGFAPRLVQSEACADQLVLEAIGDTVWLDIDGDGVQEIGAGDVVLANVIVELLLASDDSLVATTITDDNGRYEFNRFESGLVANELYNIEIVAPSGLHATLRDVADDTLDSDALRIAGATEERLRVVNASVAVESEDFTFDFGVTAPLVIGDLLFFDANEDGVQNDDAASVFDAGVTVQLFADDGVGGLALLATTATDGAGFYNFSSLDVIGLLPNNEYAIVVSLDSQPELALELGGRTRFFVPTVAGAGGDALLDSNAELDPVTNTTAIVRFTAPPTFNSDDLTLDIGLVVPPLFGFRVGDTLFLDNNLDGALDANDTLLAGARVELRNATDGALLASVLTDADGVYVFDSELVEGLDATEWVRLRGRVGQPDLLDHRAAHHESLEGDVLDLDPLGHRRAGAVVLDHPGLGLDRPGVGEVEAGGGLLAEPAVGVLPDAGQAVLILRHQDRQAVRGRDDVVVHQPGAVPALLVGGAQAEVEPAGAAEVLLGADHLQRQPAAALLVGEDPRRVVAAVVVHHDHRVGAVLERGEPVEHAREQVGSVEGHHDDGDGLLAHRRYLRWPVKSPRRPAYAARALSATRPGSRRVSR